MKLGELGSFGRVRVMSPRKLTSESTEAFESTDTYLLRQQSRCLFRTRCDFDTGSWGRFSILNFTFYILTRSLVICLGQYLGRKQSSTSAVLSYGLSNFE